MADFNQAFERMIHDEGGYILHDVEGDTGGMTYAGIARNKNPQWPGWSYLDRKETPPSQMVRDFYKAEFWDDMKGDDLFSNQIASNIFNFYVNTGRPAKVLAQVVLGLTPDGAFGDKTVQALNATDPEKFIMAYTLAKIARYRDIVMKNRAQAKFLLGWINRSLGGLT